MQNFGGRWGGGGGGGKKKQYGLWENWKKWLRKILGAGGGGGGGGGKQEALWSMRK